MAAAGDQDSRDDAVSMVQQTLLGDAWEHAAVAAAVFSEDGRYIACNQAFCRLTGYDREEILRMRAGVDLAVDRTKNTELVRQVVGERGTVGSGGLRRKDGSTTIVSFWTIETRAASTPYFIALYWESSQRPRRREVG